MSMLSKNLEKSLHRAFALAGERRHEYATLEHLLLAMTEDEDATPVLKACGVDIDRLRHVTQVRDFFIFDQGEGAIVDRPQDDRFGLFLRIVLVDLDAKGHGDRRGLLVAD